jgi:hypothetical protein
MFQGSLIIVSERLSVFLQNLMRQVSARERDCEELMEHSASAMFCVDTEARVTGWNTAMERVSGVEQGVALGKSLLGELLGPGGLLVQVPYGASGDVMTELSALLGHLAPLPTLVIASGADEYVPPGVDRAGLGERIAAAIGPSATSACIPGGLHALVGKEEEAVEHISSFCFDVAAVGSE